MATKTIVRSVRGMEELSYALREIPREMQREILGVAVEAAARPLLAAAKMGARRSVDTGALYASLTSITRKYPQTSTAVAIVGPDNAYRVGHRVRINSREERKLIESAGIKASRPAWYSHLVEFGFHARDGSAVPPRPFMRPAIMATQQASYRALLQGVEEGIEKVRRRVNKPPSTK